MANHLNIFDRAIGYDPLRNFETFFGAPQSFPPYNIERLSDGKYRLTMAVAGFSKDNIKVYVTKNVLHVEGDVSSDGNYVDNGEEKVVATIARNIANRKFKQSFAMDRGVEVLGATVKDGMLTVTLKQYLPKEEEPKYIAIE